MNKWHYETDAVMVAYRSESKISHAPPVASTSAAEAAEDRRRAVSS
jgi:hypothetical protein